MSPSLVSNPFATQQLDGVYTVTKPPSQAKNGFGLEIAGAHHRYLAFWQSANPPQLGDRLQIHAEARPIKKNQSVRLVEGIEGQVTLNSSNATSVSHGNQLLHTAFNATSNWKKVLQQDIGGREGALVGALALNDSSQLSSNDREELESTGCIFLIAASGLHLFIFESLFMALFLPELVPKALRLTILGILIAIYVGMTGFHASTIRAGFMVILAASAYLFNRQYDGLSALSLAGIIYLFWRPSGVFEPGFQLTMLAVTTLVLGNRAFPRVDKSGLMTSFWGWLGATPVGALWFQTVSIVGPIACLLPVFALAPMILLCMIDGAVHGISTTFSIPFAIALKFLAMIVWDWIDFWSQFPWSSHDIEHVSGYLIGFLYLGLFGWLILVGERRQEMANERSLS